MLASGQGHPALAAGDAIGANLVILTLTLGLAALVTRLPVTRRALEYGVAAAVLGAVSYLLMLNGVLGRLEGAVLVLLYVAGVVWVWRREQTPPLIGEMAELEEKDRRHRRRGRRGRAPAARCCWCCRPGRDGRRRLPRGPRRRGAGGRAAALSESVIGLTVLALATSAEMVALVWAARRRGLTEVVVAGTVGAVAYNSTVSLGLAALVSPLGLGRHNVMRHRRGADRGAAAGAADRRCAPGCCPRPVGARWSWATSPRSASVRPLACVVRTQSLHHSRRSSMQQVRGVVAKAKGEPVSIETINIPDPGPGEAVVAIQACGVCHTDLHYREGGINDEFPFLLGHEAAGVVESVGEGVDSVAPGDFVVLNWRAVCGTCRACSRGEPWYCFSTFNATQKMTLEDGTELSPALGIGAFADKTLVHAGQCTKVDPAARPAAVGLLGCGVMAGLGAAINTGNVGRGRVVAVIGCGGVGAAAVAGARLAGAAHDHRGRHRRAEARVGHEPRRHAHREQLGAATPVEAIQELHRRLRRRRGDRRGRPPGDLEAGVLRPRPGRHRRAGRRARPRT